MFKETEFSSTQEIRDAVSAAAGEDVAVFDYMRVQMNGEAFLLPVPAVLGILRPVTLTPVPMAPDHLMGVANIRGQIFCIVDPGKALHLKQARKAQDTNSRFLLLRHARVNLGMWVEEVFDLHRVREDELPEDTGHVYQTGVINTQHGDLPILRVQVLFD
ncbi:MAG: chemotaxis protein CheW [Mariprofundaceae bacterium]|nr:chemotaxis protein CheW [Mariprofundaceae bacterium]